MKQHKPQIIRYEVEFALTDWDKLCDTYPNFRYCFSSFADFARCLMYDVRFCLDTNVVKGAKVRVRKLSNKKHHGNG